MRVCVGVDQIRQWRLETMAFWCEIAASDWAGRLASGQPGNGSRETDPAVESRPISDRGFGVPQVDPRLSTPHPPIRVLFLTRRESREWPNMKNKNRFLPLIVCLWSTSQSVGRQGVAKCRRVEIRLPIRPLIVCGDMINQPISDQGCVPPLVGRCWTRSQSNINNVTKPQPTIGRSVRADQRGVALRVRRAAVADVATLSEAVRRQLPRRRPDGAHLPAAAEIGQR